MRYRLSSVVALSMLAMAGLAAEERPDADAFWRIRREGTDRSRVLDTVRVLTDLYGPRLTGSPNLKAAGEWAAERLRTYGLGNAALEPWEFGHPGWTNERLSVHLVAPVTDALVVEALAWTPGTKGAVRARAVQVSLPQRPTADQLTAELEKLRGTVRDRIVLIGEPQRVPVTFTATPLRREDADVQTQMNAPPARAGGPQPQGGRGGGGPQQTQPLAANEVEERVNLFLAQNGAVARLTDAGRDHGQIRAFNNRTFDVSKAPTVLVVRNEDYGRVWRLLSDNHPVELELDVVNRTHPEGRTAYNVVAEIAGSDKADEVVMLGGHLDSWHAATGATDNAVGCAIMMEAARIIVAAGLKPRRTIRVALWSGEEQGLLGSQAYVRQHFGMAEDPKPAHGKLSAYFNVDSGTGRARGMTVFGPSNASSVLRETVSGLSDLGVLGATTTRSRARGGSDHTSFNEAGLPGVVFLLDPIQYQTHTWHTNLDTYERIVEDDVKKTAIVVASAVYHVAMREALFPRFDKADMPARPQQAPPVQTPPAAPPVQSPSVQIPAATTSGPLADGTDYRIDYPATFNGTVLVGLDYASSPADAPVPRALLARGYAMAGTTRRVTGWSVKDAVANQVATLDLFERRFGKPRHAVVYGSSLGGHVGAAVVQAHPSRFSGAMLACGGHAGTVAMWNSKFDALWIAKTLIAPNDASLPVLDVPADFATTARPAWIARLAAAQKTPDGRARIALAAVIAQLPTWSVPTKPQPASTDVAALQEGLFDSLAGGPLPLVGQAMSSRFEITRRAGGNISSNDGVDYGMLLARMRLAPLVRTLYREAGLSLDADLATLTKAPRVKADPAAVAWTAPGNWTGRVEIPVLTLNAPGDQISMISGERYYQRATDAAGFGANVRHLYANGAGHCPFTTAEHVTAIELLATRLETGRWPDTTATAATTRAKQLALGDTRFIDDEPEEVARPFPVLAAKR